MCVPFIYSASLVNLFLQAIQDLINNTVTQRSACAARFENFQDSVGHYLPLDNLSYEHELTLSNIIPPPEFARAVSEVSLLDNIEDDSG